MRAPILSALIGLALSAPAAANTYSIAGTGSAGFLSAGYSVVGVADIDGDHIPDIIRFDSSTNNIWFGGSMIGTLPAGWWVVGGGTESALMRGILLVQDASNNLSIINVGAGRNDYLGQAPAGYRIVAVGAAVTQGPLVIAWQNAAGDVIRWKLKAQPQYVIDTNTDEGVIGTLIFGYEYLSRNDSGNSTFFGSANLYHQRSPTSGAPTVYSDAPAPSGYVPVAVDDFNGDSQSDVIWINPTTKDVLIGATTSCAAGTLAHPGVPAVTYSSLGTVPAGFAFAGSGDLNGDGAVDLLFYNSTTYEMQVWLGAKTGTDTCSSTMFPPFSFNQGRP